MLGLVTPDMSTLFDQLGLASNESSIEAFIAGHKPLEPSIKLADAPFWTPAQATFLAEAIDRDGSWAIIVDELDARLREA